MSRAPQPRLPRAIRDELDRSGLPWGLSLGGKHWKLVVAGEVVTVISHRPHWDWPSHTSNTLAAVRRVIRKKEAQ